MWSEIARCWIVLAAIGCGSSAPEPPPPEPDAGAPATGWYGLQDVSVLLPLPSGYSDRNLLSLSSTGNGGPLLDEDRFDGLANGFGAYADWRIVSARIDPCFPDLAMLASRPEACRRQLRLIAQPLAMIDTATPFQFADSSLHLLFDLSPAQFDEMSQRWLALATLADDSRSIPLGVHARIAAQGLAGEVSTKLREIIKAYAGPATLSQVSFFSVVKVDVGQAWLFSGVKIASTGDTPISIPVFAQTTEIVKVPDMQMFPSASLPLVPLVATTGAGGTLASDPATVTATLQASLDIDNPTRPFNIDTIDCASCHLANRLRSRAAMLGSPSTGLESFAAPPFNLASTLSTDLDDAITAMRAFGYNFRDPIWSQRTINESAAVAGYFNAQLAAARGQ